MISDPAPKPRKGREGVRNPFKIWNHLSPSLLQTWRMQRWHFLTDAPLSFPKSYHYLLLALASWGPSAMGKEDEATQSAVAGPAGSELTPKLWRGDAGPQLPHYTVRINNSSRLWRASSMLNMNSFSPPTSK